MATQLQFRRGTTAQNNAFTGAAGEISIDTGTKNIRIHDGSNAGGAEIIPAGTIVAYGSATLPANAGWLKCDDSAVSRTTYARLFAVIGTTYGAGNGSTTFNVPDFRDRVPLGLGTNNSSLGAETTGAAASAVMASATKSGVNTGASNTGTSNTGTGNTGTGNTGTGNTGTGSSTGSAGANTVASNTGNAGANTVASNTGGAGATTVGYNAINNVNVKTGTGNTGTGNTGTGNTGTGSTGTGSTGASDTGNQNAAITTGTGNTGTG